MQLKTQGFFMRLSSEDRAALDQLAEREERSASDAIRRLIRQAVESNGRAPAAKQGSAPVREA